MSRVTALVRYAYLALLGLAHRETGRLAVTLCPELPIQRED